MSVDVEALRKYARAMSILAMREAGGGSEMFVTIAGEPYADPKLCEERITSKRLHQLEMIKRSKAALREANAALLSELERMREALEPFARVAETDIAADEADSDIFRPMRGQNRAPLLLVGDLRRAARAQQKER